MTSSFSTQCESRRSSFEAKTQRHSLVSVQSEVSKIKHTFGGFGAFTFIEKGKIHQSY